MIFLLVGSIITIVTGCLVFIKSRAELSDKLTGFECRINLFTPAERLFLGVLEQALDSRYRVFVNVRLEDFIQLPYGLNTGFSSAVMKKIHQKRVGFVICTIGDFAPVGICELNNRSRRRMDWTGRDELFDRVLAEAGIPVVRFLATRTYAVQEIRTRLEGMMCGESKTDDTLVILPGITPLNSVLEAILKSIPVQTETSQFACPECSAVMVKRLAVKDHSFGKYFWACSTFPKCRRIVEIVKG